jgi:hypothetical protein
MKPMIVFLGLMVVAGVAAAADVNVRIDVTIKSDAVAELVDLLDDLPPAYQTVTNSVVVSNGAVVVTNQVVRVEVVPETPRKKFKRISVGHLRRCWRAKIASYRRKQVSGDGAVDIEE